MVSVVLGLLMVAVAGPWVWAQVTVTVAGGLGRPSSLMVPSRVMLPGAVITAGTAVAVTWGGWLMGPLPVW